MEDNVAFGFHSDPESEIAIRQIDPSQKNDQATFYLLNFIYEEIVAHTNSWGERVRISCQVTNCDLLVYAPSKEEQELLDLAPEEIRTNALIQFKAAGEFFRNKKMNVLPIIVDTRDPDYQSMGSLVNTFPKFAERTSMITLISPRLDKVRSFPLDLTDSQWMKPSSMSSEFIMMWVRFFTQNDLIINLINEKSELQRNKRMDSAMKKEKVQGVNAAAKEAMDEITMI